MSNSTELAELFGAAWSGTSPGLVDDDYRLLARVGCGFAARTKQGLLSLLVPLPALDAHAVGRRAAGCELVAVTSARFRFGADEWESAAAALVCHESEIVDTFRVLAADIIARVGSEPTWGRVLELVAEWQALLTPKGRPNAEAELGLWGELWFIASTADLASVVAGWRGPDGDAADFFLGEIAAEVKTSRYRRQHHVSLSQVTMPVGDRPAWFLSIWAKEDPIRGLAVPDLVARIEAHCPDRGDLHRRLLRAGYAHATRASYTSRFVVLAEPEWYEASTVPSVREIDPGVSDVRYRVTLDPAFAADAATAAGLWTHFLGHGYSSS